jgi:lysophospholipase L1-like esterase
MLECLILGDSIAKGTSDIRKECVAYVKSGINSRDWRINNQDKTLSAKTVIISLGTNDLRNINTRDELVSIRSRVHAQQVYWILPPIKPQVQDIVKAVAQEYGDVIIATKNLSQDNIHPTYAGYKELGEKTR